MQEEMGKLVRRKREEMGMSSTELGYRLGIGQVQVLRYERGLSEYSAPMWMKVKDILQITPEEEADLLK